MKTSIHCPGTTTTCTRCVWQRARMAPVNWSSILTTFWSGFRKAERSGTASHPTRLRFFGVTDLRIDIDWAISSAAMGPFSIDGIERRIEQRTHYEAVCWRIPVNFPPGEIRFEATGFEQHLSGTEVLVDHQCLTRSERRGASQD